MKFLILNQAFYPDIVSTGQHACDLACELSAQGHSVTVISSSRAYDDPRKRFPPRERWNGIDIIRVPSTGFGKRAKWRRAVDFGSYMAACFMRLVFLKRHDVVIALTSPPLISFLGALFTTLRGGKFVFWVMDMNPDEAIAAGWLRADSITARVLQWMLRFGMKRADLLVALDRFMAQRIERKGIDAAKIRVIAPWLYENEVQFDEEGRKAFRKEHGLENKFVVMYSGNHSPCHPLDTLLQAAEKLANNQQVKFCFVGGGSEFARVQRFAQEKYLSNILCLPYQPFSKLRASLSSADLHVVVMGEPFRGIVHPCKIYNILAIGTPFLYIGPAQSHVGDILRVFPKLPGFQAEHGDTDAVVAHVVHSATSCKEYFSPEQTAVESFGRKLLANFADELEKLGLPEDAKLSPASKHF